MLGKGKRNKKYPSAGEWLERLRHKRGFGVHSAFAYRMVTDVIRPLKVYGYYGYHQIDCAEEGNAHLIRTENGILRASAVARMLLRLAVALRPKNILVSRNLPGVITRALRSADSTAVIKPKFESTQPPQLTVVESNHPIVAGLPAILSHDGAIAMIIGGTTTLANRLFESLDEGVIFEGRKYILIFSRSGMQKQYIRI